MKIQSIGTNYSHSKPNFQGEFKKLIAERKNPDGTTYNEVIEPLEYDFDFTNIIEQAEKTRGNIQVERTIGAFHTKPTNLIYYASPLERVSDYDRVKADYVVYDLEPRMPKVEGEVSENYFGTERINYGDEYKKVQDYFYRLEMDSLNEAKSIEYRMYGGVAVYDSQKLLNQYRERIQYAKEKQRDIQKARDIYHSADWQRGTKEHYENMIKDSLSQLEKMAIDLKTTKENLAKDNKLKKENTYQRNLIADKINAYEKVQKINDRLDALNIADSIFEIEEYIENNKTLAAKLDEELSKLNNKIKEEKLHIVSYPQRVAAVKKVIKELTVKLEKAKADLIPMFDKLKNHCIKHGIRG